MRFGLSLTILCLLLSFQGVSASKGRELFDQQEKKQLQYLKSDEALIERYREALKSSGGQRLKGFLNSMAQQEKMALMREWREPENYWELVDKAMTQYYFQKWLRREWHNLEENDMFDLMPRE